MWLVLLLRDAITLPEEVAGTEQVGEDDHLQGQGQHGHHCGHSAELDGTGTDNGCCKEGEEHGMLLSEMGCGVWGVGCGLWSVGYGNENEQWKTKRPEDESKGR